MKFEVVKTKEAQKDYDSLTDEQKAILNSDYKAINENGLETVKTRYLDKGLFEIKTGNLRSLYGYREGQIILVTVIYVKKQQKAPIEVIKRAKKLLKKYNTL